MLLLFHLYNSYIFPEAEVSLRTDQKKRFFVLPGILSGLDKHSNYYTRDTNYFNIRHSKDFIYLFIQFFKVASKWELCHASVALAKSKHFHPTLIHKGFLNIILEAEQILKGKSYWVFRINAVGFLFFLL